MSTPPEAIIEKLTQCILQCKDIAMQHPDGPENIPDETWDTLPDDLKKIATDAISAVREACTTEKPPPEEEEEGGGRARTNIGSPDRVPPTRGTRNVYKC
eukprot:TRINITY_DN5533_c0_g6_i2.p1 TRINITY_DN5533_c0_g6~~TRINITY_DN5533_c0_g6_i2.p1  ORF type:complete len:100 (+),score=19.01 TRINITY_DN5533_c0_g6_i2:83-382(+)